MSLDYLGVNLSGLEFGKKSADSKFNIHYTVSKESHYDYWVDDVGVNVIRLPFMWERLQHELHGELNQDYVQHILDAVNYATERGATIILDMHNYAKYNGQTIGTDAVPTSAFEDVWVKLATLVQDHSNVWLGLMNEPNKISAEDWAVQNQAAVNALREAGIENKLLVTGNGWSAGHMFLKNGNGEVFADFHDPLDNYAIEVHQYMDQYNTGWDGTAKDGAGSTRLIAITEWAKANGHELFLGEFGVSDPSIEGQESNYLENQAMLDYMAANGDVWLGGTMWGAGAWWPSHYHFKLTPEDLKYGGATDQPMLQYVENYIDALGDSNKILPVPAVAETLVSQEAVISDDTYETAELPSEVASDTSLSGSQEADVIQGSYDDDTITGAAGNDTIFSSVGHDHAIGGEGNDNMHGHTGNDTLSGGKGFDWMEGGAGDDLLVGGAQADALHGGKGADTFLFEAITDSRSGIGKRDTIHDFTQGEDKLDFTALVSQIAVVGEKHFSGNLQAEARQSIEGDKTIISLDFDGNGSEDMALAITGNDFILHDTDFIQAH